MQKKYLENAEKHSPTLSVVGGGGVTYSLKTYFQFKENM
jgi:hypothetical protein